MLILLFLSQPDPGDINVASHLRKSIYRSAAINAALVLVIGLTTAAMTHSMDLSPRNLLVLLLATLLIGAIAAWVKMHSIVENLLRMIPKASAWCRVPRGQPINGITIDWQAMDEQAAQLEALGFLHLGDFSPWPLSKQMVSVSAMYCDSNATTLLEIQWVEWVQAGPSAQATGGRDNGVHFSIFTVLGGNIRVTTTDHAPQARDYLMRSVGDVVAAHPGQSLMVLMEKHRRLIQNLRERTGQAPATGLSMKRYVLLQRERFEWVRLRLRELGGYKVSVEFDWFEANPALNYAPSSATLAALPCRGLDALDTSPLAQTQPLLRDWADSQSSLASATTGKNPQTAAGDAPDAAQLHQQVARAANWFYWIAALSVFNFVADAIGSNWGFALGLGLSQLLGVGAKNFLASEAPGAAVFAMYAAAVGSIAFFAACGWFARKPSVFVFMVGIVFFALDTLIFLIALDGMGIAIHLVALYFLRQGVPAARTLRAEAA